MMDGTAYFGDEKVAPLTQDALEQMELEEVLVIAPPHYCDITGFIIPQTRTIYRVKQKNPE